MKADLENYLYDLQCLFKQNFVLCSCLNTHLHLQYLPAATLLKAGAGLFGRFFRTQSIRNCFGDFPVQLRAV